MMRDWRPHVIVIVNGAPREVQDGLKVADLLAQLGLESRLVAVEQNQEIVPRQRHDSTAVEDGDRFEIVTLVGGG